MSRYHSHLNTAKNLIESYKGKIPFASFQKQFFAANKKYGAKDRSQISSLCFNYFRMGFASTGVPINQKLLTATFLCEQDSSEFLKNMRPVWNEKISLPLEKKLQLTKEEFYLNDIFPFINELSDGIEPGEFCKSFLRQPDLYIRIRPKTSVSVVKKLVRSKIKYQLHGEDCVQMPTSENVEDFFIIDKEVVIQDYSSQRVLNFLKTHLLLVDSLFPNPKLNLSVWDCCAASGGKSILLHDILRRKIDLTVSDIRAGTIHLLHQRFKKAFIKEYKYYIADITAADFKPRDFCFDIILCDAPCTGSGTWSRIPEQLCYFKPAEIEKYTTLQKKIITGVVPHLKKGGLFFYITCSVFKNENERMAAFIIENFNCKLLHLQLLKGYDKKADTMFVAVLQKM